jgi:hypothetical protein
MVWARDLAINRTFCPDASEVTLAFDGALLRCLAMSWGWDWNNAEFLRSSPCRGRDFRSGVTVL